MTVTLSRTIVEPKWNTHEIQESNAIVHARTMLAAMKHVAKLGGDKAVEEFQTELRSFRVESLKKVGVKTPIDLVKALAEFEANLFGSKIEIWGDEAKAFMAYNQCAMWNAMKKVGQFTEKQEEEMGSKFEHCMQMLAKEFGFKGETKFEGEACTLSFSK
jgi:hypothetical protein